MWKDGILSEARYGLSEELFFFRKLGQGKSVILGRWIFRHLIVSVSLVPVSYI